VDHKLCKDCKGFCCDDIGLYVSPSELQNSYHEVMLPHRDRGKSMSMSAEDTEKIPRWEDIHLTYPMLIFSHQDYIHPDGEINYDDENSREAVYHYSCKHHNKKDGGCDIYEERPMMCRTFPNSGFCGYRKVKDKRVKSFRPKWFKIGMTYHDWYYGMHPDEKEDKPTNECPTEVKAEETEQ